MEGPIPRVPRRTDIDNFLSIGSPQAPTGVIVVEADNLDTALAIAQELQDTRTSGAIEVRPILEALFHGA